MDKIRDRLETFIDSVGLSVYAFESKCGLANGTVSKMTDRSRRMTLNKIVSAFPQLNIEWLKTGFGQMLKTQKEIDATRIDSDGDTLINSLKIGDPAALIRVEDELCNYKREVEYLKTIIANKDEQITLLKSLLEAREARILTLEGN